MTRFAVVFHATIFVLVVPALEISGTHLFNADWPAHARLHEAWQLLTNASLSVLALFFVWRWRRPMSALAICLAVSMPFMMALAMQAAYGGSMRHSDGTELAVFGVNAATLLMLGILGVLCASLYLEIQVNRVERQA